MSIQMLDILTFLLLSLCTTLGRVVCGPMTLERKSKGGRVQTARERERERHSSQTLVAQD